MLVAIFFLIMNSSSYVEEIALNQLHSVGVIENLKWFYIKNPFLFGTKENATGVVQYHVHDHNRIQAT